MYQVKITEHVYSSLTKNTGIAEVSVNSCKMLTGIIPGSGITGSVFFALFLISLPRLGFIASLKNVAITKIIINHFLAITGRIRSSKVKEIPVLVLSPTER